MSLPKLTVCPGTLKAGFETYSPAALRNVFFGKKVSHVLPYPAPKRDEATLELFMKNRERLSISGVQEKLSIIQEKNLLRLTREGEQGTHILKPIPRDLKKVDEVPANEHLTMQIAAQLYGIKTAPNALIFFKDGEPAYITKRFDVKEGGGKWGKEDFASLAGKTGQKDSLNFKYEYDYLRLGELIHTFIPTWRIEIESYFSLVLFNYVFSNGDAHLKNFAVLESQSGDYRLSPAYDLINTRLHVNDTNFALIGGLFSKEKRSVNYQNSGNPNYQDFFNFGLAIGITEKRVEKLMLPFIHKNPLVEEMIQHSFLSNSSKKGYLIHYNTKLGQLR